MQIKFALLANGDVPFERLPQRTIKRRITRFENAHADLHILHPQQSMAEAQGAATHLIHAATLLIVGVR